METLCRYRASMLLVEDEEVALRLLATILGKKYPELTLHCAVNGRSGLGLFREQLPDLVITDINMPEMSGAQMVDTIRGIKPGVKIIVLTAGTGSTALEQAGGKGQGVDHYILKPINFGTLFGAIDDCLREVARGREAPREDPTGLPAALSGLLDALEGDQGALAELVGDFLDSYPGHLQRISAAVCAGDARLLERSAHQFKGSLGIFCRSEPLALTQRLIDMGERETLAGAPVTFGLLEREMEQLALSLRRVAGL